uniref:Fibrinogen C-terminal domain-containing protein n=2 Tax=Anopheles arabiensis TaxID=7173 RepID=A0A8W7MTP6_ANOAR
MYVFKVTLCLALIVFSATVHGDELDVTESTLEGFEYQTLTAKLDYLQHKLTEMDFAIKEERKAIDETLEHQKNVSEWILSIMNQQSQTLRHNLSEVTGPSVRNQRMVSNFMALHIQSNEMLTVQIANANYERLRKDVEMLLSNQHLAQFMISSGFNLQSVSFRSCKKTPSKRSGKYLMQPTENDEPFIGYCEQTSFGGGWLVFQYRFNGSVDFYRDWVEYRNGFDSVDGEFWLGLEHLHRITRDRKHELLVELKDFEGNYKYARYSEFEIGSEGVHYQLKQLGTYTGAAGDSLTYHKGMTFTTKDKDNDESGSKNCAENYDGAWWYGNCYASNLNGVYMNRTDAKSMNWYDYKLTFMGLAYSRMLIREK